ncbi:MAG: FAD-binding protein [Chloroflexi bacterium]|nr:FAD-binding protein [Chloroflexota bacterium]
MIHCRTIEEVQEAVQAHRWVRLCGRGSKPALFGGASPDAETVCLSGLVGVERYDPAEYVFTAQAGTPLQVIEAMLAEEGQYLPVDAMFVERGGSLGGLVAANLAGPGRYRYGGVRDFLLGARFVDGRGRLVRGGGRVVKNAAGFDLARLMVGSMGLLAALVEVSFKVFPRPEAYGSVRARYDGLKGALAAMERLSRAQFDIDALDLAPEGFPSGRTWLWARMGGREEALAARLAAFLQALEEGPAEVDVAWDEEEARFWRDARELAWVEEGETVVKVPLTPKQALRLERGFAEAESCAPLGVRYGVAGNVAWLRFGHLPKEKMVELDERLAAMGLAGLVVMGEPGVRWLGEQGWRNVFFDRVKAVLDPEGRFV